MFWDLKTFIHTSNFFEQCKILKRSMLHTSYACLKANSPLNLPTIQYLCVFELLNYSVFPFIDQVSILLTPRTPFNFEKLAMCRLFSRYFGYLKKCCKRPKLLEGFFFLKGPPKPLPPLENDTFGILG